MPPISETEDENDMGPDPWLCRPRKLCETRILPAGEDTAFDCVSEERSENAPGKGDGTGASIPVKCENKKCFENVFY